MNDTTANDEAVQVLDVGALEVLNKSEIEAQVDTARKYPRQVSLVLEQAAELACIDEQTAASCFYSLPSRGDGPIAGPSVRLAEVMANSWGNLRFGSRIVDIGDRFVTAQGFCMDLEKNVAYTAEVKRGIVTKYGKRYPDHLIMTTCNAACSIAFRNAVFKVVPLALVMKIYRQCQSTALGGQLTVEQWRGKAIEAYEAAGATKEQVLGAVGRRKAEDITIEDLIHLRGMLTAIKDGELTLEAAMQPPGTEAPVEGSTLTDDVQAAKQQSEEQDEDQGEQADADA